MAAKVSLPPLSTGQKTEGETHGWGRGLSEVPSIPNLCGWSLRWTCGSEEYINQAPLCWQGAAPLDAAWMVAVVHPSTWQSMVPKADVALMPSLEAMGAGSFERPPEKKT